eukprot:COSAG01_NODE_689_length_14220_cov_363.812903_14_plen_351_part_00
MPGSIGALAADQGVNYELLTRGAAQPASRQPVTRRPRRPPAGRPRRGRPPDDRVPTKLPERWGYSSVRYLTMGSGPVLLLRRHYRHCWRIAPSHNRRAFHWRAFASVAAAGSGGSDDGERQRCIGILGGMSPSSTELYYRKLNSGVRDRLGGLHSADCIIRSVDFAEIEALQSAGEWEVAGERLAAAARGLEAGGAELLLLATNTMHKVAPAITSATTVPFLDIFSCTADAVLRAGCHRPALMATRYTMEQKFCTGKLIDAGLHPVVPDAEARAEIHRIIFDELCVGTVTAKSRRRFEAIARDLVTRCGADSVILGCTEIGMLLHAENVDAPVFDTTELHCEAALNFAVG